MSRAELLVFMRRYRVAVQTSVAVDGSPQAAIVGVAVGDNFEIVFDTVESSRKARNLRQNPRTAFVFGGWGPAEEETIQYEGLAEVPAGAELERIRALYFGVYPDGLQRLAWAGLIHVQVRPTWLRYSDFRQSAGRVVEWRAEELKALV